LAYVIFSNFYPVPEYPFNILPLVFGAFLLAAVLWYAYLKRSRPDVAKRVGTIQTLSEEEQRRLADDGIREVLTGHSAGTRDDDSQPREKEPLAP
jgi:hypothetical protein